MGTKQIESEIKALRAKMNALERKRRTSIIENEEYLSDLSLYEGRYLSSITAISPTVECIPMPMDEGGGYVSDGKFRCSSLSSGIFRWSEEDESYIRLQYGNKEILDVIGFIDVENGD
ncbi:MAG: hypothetical protein PQJ60_10855 [Spirochaetales bacterium]|nr:hypothetical protein [Spirochaetales bacterium]